MMKKTIYLKKKKGKIMDLQSWTKKTKVGEGNDAFWRSVDV